MFQLLLVARDNLIRAWNLNFLSIRVFLCFFLSLFQFWGFELNILEIVFESEEDREKVEDKNTLLLIFPNILIDMHLIDRQ